MTTYAMPSDSEGRLIGPAVEQVRKLVAEAAPPATDVDPGILHAATCRMESGTPATIILHGHDGSPTDVTVTGLVTITRTGVYVEVQVQSFDKSGSLHPAGVWKIDAEPLGLPSIDGVVSAESSAHNAETGDRTPLTTDFNAHSAIWSTDVEWTGLTQTMRYITADPAPAGSY